MSTPHQLWALAVKELNQIVFSVGAAVSQLMNAALSLVLMAYAATMDLKDCPFGVLDRENTSETRAIAAKFEHSEVFRRQPDFRDEKDLARRIDDQSVRFAIVFPSNFTRSRNVQLVADGRNTVSSGTAMMYASSILNEWTMDVSYPDMTGHRRGLTEDRAWFNPLYSPQWFQIPGLLAQLLLITLGMTIAMPFAKEKETGSLDQLRLTPYTPFELLVGKGIAGTVIGLCQFLFTLVVSVAWFHLPMKGSTAALAVMALAFIVAAVGFGNLIAVCAKSQQQAAVASFVVVIPFVMLDGLTTPIACMPLPLQYFAKVNPVAYANVALHRIFLEGAGLADVFGSALALFAMGLVLFLVAWLRFRRK